MQLGRGRGRGKEGKVIEALLRNRIFCPGCGKPLAVRRLSGSDKHYYFCLRLIRASETRHCTYRRFVPGAWDAAIWDCVYALLKQDSWVKERLSEIEKQGQDISKLVKLEQQKMLQTQTRINRVREGFEGGLYNLEEAKSKLNHYQNTADKAQKEIDRLLALNGKTGKINVAELEKELERLSQENLDKATFAEKRDIIGKLGMRVYPSEDLKSVKIKLSLNPGGGGNGQKECVIVEFASLRSQ